MCEQFHHSFSCYFCTSLTVFVENLGVIGNVRNRPTRVSDYPVPLLELITRPSLLVILIVRSRRSASLRLRIRRPRHRPSALTGRQFKCWLFRGCPSFVWVPEGGLWQPGRDLCEGVHLVSSLLRLSGWIHNSVEKVLGLILRRDSYSPTGTVSEDRALLRVTVRSDGRPKDWTVHLGPLTVSPVYFTTLSLVRPFWRDVFEGSFDFRQRHPNLQSSRTLRTVVRVPSTPRLYSRS